MAVTLDATVGGANSNSYLTVDEANAYFETRLASSAWEESDEQAKALMMATRVLDMMAQPYKQYIAGARPYYLTRARWTGAPATTTQKLAWPRTGMFDANGNAIASTVIPQALKDATAELAMQLITADRTLDSEVAVQGITSLKVGSISMTFKDFVEGKVIPDAVWNLLPPSWFIGPKVEYVSSAVFEML